MNNEETTERKNQAQELPSSNQIPKTINADEVKRESIQMPNKTKQELKEEKKALKRSLKKKKQPQKTDYTNSLLILAICLLVIVIIAPPILRKLMPKIDIPQKTNNETTVILSCVGVNTEEKYRVNSRTKYVDDNIKQNIITYKKLTEEEVALEIKNTPTISISPTSEISFFQTIKGLNIDFSQDKVIVSIQDYSANKNTSNFKFMNYFQEKETQKKFYTSQGFSCEEIKD